MEPSAPNDAEQDEHDADLVIEQAVEQSPVGDRFRWLQGQARIHDTPTAPGDCFFGVLRWGLNRLAVNTDRNLPGYQPAYLRRQVARSM